MKANAVIFAMFFSVAMALPERKDPMYRTDAFKSDDPELEREDERLLASKACTYRKIAVRTSEYVVDYKQYVELQYGNAPVYSEDLSETIGTWYWEWINDVYGTMMIFWNEQESLFFGFSSYQSYYPIAGGWMNSLHCPHGYVRFLEQQGETRFYSIRMCGDC